MGSSMLDFEQSGYRVIKNCLTDGEVAHAIGQLEMLSGTHVTDAGKETFDWNIINGVSRTPSLWPLIFHERLLETLRAVFKTPDIRYLEHSDLKVWRHRPASGWHRDSISERFGVGDEWNEAASAYQVVRVAFYLQPVEYAFAWGAIPGSHLREYQMKNWEKLLWRRLPRRQHVSIASRLPYLEASHGHLWIRERPLHLLPQPPAQDIWITTQPNDCIIFDPRLIHAGGNVHRGKYAAFFAFGANNEHSRQHKAHFDWQPHQDTERDIQAQLWAKLREADLFLP
jgi:hypothetical protein